MRFGLSVLSLLCGCLFQASVALGSDNAVTNAELNGGTEISGWSSDFGTWSVWSGTSDANACEGSGSGWGASAWDAGQSKQYLRIYAPGCLPLAPAQPLWFQFDYWTTAPFVRVVLWNHQTSNCSDPHGLFYLWTVGPSGGGWAHADIPLANTSDAAAVSIQIDAWSLSQLDDFSLLVDRLYLGTADRIFSDDFEGARATPFCRWSASVP